MPVELTSFSVEIIENSVTLTWMTESETNNFGFEIERSLDGKLFAKIGFVQGQGTTTVPQQYVFQDKNIQHGTLYYRLKQIDTNGAFEYSNILTVEIESPKDFALEQNYPNPFNPETFIEFRITDPTRVTLKIYNLSGKEVTTILDEPLPAGLHQVKWNGRNNRDKLVSSGIYIYEVKAGGIRHSRKMLLSK